MTTTSVYISLNHNKLSSIKHFRPAHLLGPHHFRFVFFLLLPFVRILFLLGPAQPLLNLFEEFVGDPDCAQDDDNPDDYELYVSWCQKLIAADLIVVGLHSIVVANHKNEHVNRVNHLASGVLHRITEGLECEDVGEEGPAEEEKDDGPLPPLV
jgi:hypothetical protein